MPKRKRKQTKAAPKKKRKLSKKQLAALKRGREIRKANLAQKPIPKKPMTKRRRMYTGDILTGGTKDVNPQYMHGLVKLSATDVITEGAFNVPIVRIPTASKVTIMEILKIYWMPSAWVDGAVPANLAQMEQAINFSTIPQGTAAFATFSEPNVFAAFALRRKGAFSAGGSFESLTIKYPLVFDMTDDAGHGFLVASDRIYVQCVTVLQTPVVQVFPWKIYYRMKSVNLQEYVGIVQSQQ